MNCQRYREELEDYIYRELSEARSNEIKAHLAVCGACAAARDELEREHDIFAQFYEQTALEPGAEMWDAIRSRIGEEPRTTGERTAGRLSEWLGELPGGGVFSWLLRPAIVGQVAFAVVLIAISVATTTYLLKRGNRSAGDLAANGPQVTVTPAPGNTVTPAPVAALNPAAPAPKQTPTQLTRRHLTPEKPLTEQEQLDRQIARAEREYQNAIRMLDRAIAKRRDTLDPGLIKQYQSSLALIDDSIDQSRRAMRERPNDLAAGQFLIAAYARKVELMQDIAMR